MLAISIVEKDGFRDYIEYLDPSFNIPTRYRLKESGLPELKLRLEEKIKLELTTIDWLTISLDGWMSGISRCYNGYIAQGVDNEWTMRTILIAFEYVSASHTGDKIKQQYESVIKVYDIDKKIFKIVCDQAANNIKAFKTTLECTDDDHLIKITTMLLEKQRKLDMIEEKNKQH